MLDVDFDPDQASWNAVPGLRMTFGFSPSSILFMSTISSSICGQQVAQTLANVLLRVYYYASLQGKNIAQPKEIRRPVVSETIEKPLDVKNDFRQARFA